jgi:hypothetical protein
MSKEDIKRENLRIHNSNNKYNNLHNKEVSYFNWIARLIAYLDFGKKIWPVPSPKEVKAFQEETNYKSRSIKFKGGLKNAYKQKGFPEGRF